MPQDMKKIRLQMKQKNQSLEQVIKEWVYINKGNDQVYERVTHCVNEQEFIAMTEKLGL
jgi:hypothetical protein